MLLSPYVTPVQTCSCFGHTFAIDWLRIKQNVDTRSPIGKTLRI